MKITAKHCKSHANETIHVIVNMWHASGSFGIEHFFSMEELFSLTGLISLISLTDLWSLKALLSLITSLLKAEKIVLFKYTSKARNLQITKNITFSRAIHKT